MRSKISFKLALFIIGIAIIIFVAVNIFFQIGDKSEGSVQGVIFEELISLELPARLKIPKINVDALVKYVGITSDGTMDVPKDPADVAWFDLGPRPGEIGSAVIAGHEGWKNGIQAAFDNLYKLQKGDKVYIEDGKGTTTIFIVRDFRTYNQKEDASSVFSSSDGKAHLNLITCEGIWDKIKKSYSDRLVVFADKE